MARPDLNAAALITQTIAMVAEVGLEKISLRSIAAQAGCTTAAIFQHFGSKAELVAAAIDAALATDTAAHATVAAETGGLITDHAAFADLIATYIDQRARQPVARFWSEVLFKVRQVPEANTALSRWHAMRAEFWQTVLAGAPGGAALAGLVPAFVVMEEAYAYTLGVDAEYQLLLRETARTLTEAAYPPRAAGTRPISLSQRLGKAPLPSMSPNSEEAAAMREQLLTHAVGLIARQGIGAVSQRKLTGRAAVSSSMIAYHFGTMQGFVNEAVWRALVAGIPNELDPSRHEAQMPVSLDEWFAALDRHIRPGEGEAPPGFYTSFARITGQACLIADSQTTLLPLLRHLRALEGWGTYRVAQSLGLGDRLARDQAAAFGMWIKGQAVLREAGLTGTADSTPGIAAAARLIFPHAMQGSHVSLENFKRNN